MAIQRQMPRAMERICSLNQGGKGELPRYADDSFKIDADWKIRPPRELDETAALLRNTLQRL